MTTHTFTIPVKAGTETKVHVQTDRNGEVTRIDSGDGWGWAYLPDLIRLGKLELSRPGSAADYGHDVYRVAKGAK